jgi:hypothetical protein
MALSTTEDRQYFTWLPPAGGTIVTINYGIDSVVTNDSPFLLYRETSTGATAQLLNGTHYTIQNITTSKFEVYIYAQAGIDYPNLGTCLVWRNTPQTQSVNYIDGDTFPVSNIGKSLDKLTMMVQDMEDRMNLSIIAPKADMYDVSDNPIDLQELPPISERANKYIYFDANGQPTAVEEVTIGTITPSAFGELLVTSVDAAAGRLVLDGAKLDGSTTTDFNVPLVPTLPNHATSKSYVDSSFSGISGKNYNYFDNGQIVVEQLTGPYNQVASQQTADRWYKNYGGSTTQTVTRALASPPPYGSGIPSPVYCLTWNNTGTGYPGASEWCSIGQDIEGINLSSIRNSYVSVGFWVSCNQTVTGGARLCATFTNYNGADPYTFCYEYEIEAADTWEYKTFTMDLSGVTIDFSEGARGLKFMLCLGAGANIDNGVNMTWTNSLNACTPNQFPCTGVEGFTIGFTNITMVVGNNVLPADGSFYPNVHPTIDYDRCYRYLYVCDYKGYSRRNVNYDFMLSRIAYPQRMCKTPTIYLEPSTVLSLFGYTASSNTNTLDAISPIVVPGSIADQNNASLTLDYAAGGMADAENEITGMTNPLIFNADIY